MKLVVISDIHGRVDRADEALSRNRDADAVLFLGDGVRDVCRLSDGELAARLVGVRGNCDGFSLFGNADGNFPEERLLRFGDYKILMMHGHRYGVKHGIGAAACYAAKRGADILLYGHTHIPEETYLPAGTAVGELILERPMWIMNPGSIGEPRNGKPSFGLVQMRGDSVLLSHGTL